MQAELWPERTPNAPDPDPPSLMAEHRQPAGATIGEEAGELGGVCPIEPLSPGHLSAHLSAGQLAEAKRVGTSRQRAAMANGYRDKHGLAQRAANGLELHILGAAGEIVARDYLGLTVELSLYGFHDVPDLPPDIEVRARSRADYQLIIRDDDPPERRYVLACGPLPVLTIHGWIYGHEVIPAWREAHGGREPAFFVPTAELHPLATLPRPTLAQIARWIQLEHDAARRWRLRTRRG